MWNMNRKTANFRKEYQNNQRDIQLRRQQPIHSKGNYRIDRDGKAILSRPSILNEEQNNDYFDEDSNNQRQKESSEKRVFNLNEYRTRERDLTDRMRQTNNRNYNKPYPTHQTTQRSLANKPSRGRAWVQSVFEWMNYQWQYKPFIEGLPSGRTNLFGVFSLIYIIMLVSGWQLMPMNKVNNLIVTGNEIVPSEFLIDSSRIYNYDDIETVTRQKKSIEAIIKEENPLIESVTFNRPNWKAFELAVSEHDLVAMINIDDQSHVVLSSGDILNINSNAALSGVARDKLPLIEGFPEKKQLADLAKGLRQIDLSTLSMMDRVSYSDDPNKTNAIEVSMKDGNLIKAIISTFSQKVQHYPDVLSQLEGKTGVINFEVGAYFTPYVENANSVKLDNN